MTSVPHHFNGFNREILSPELAAELMPLLEAHYLEIAHYQDIPLKPAFEAYYAMQSAERLRLYIVRVDGEPVGYGVFFINQNMHYAGSKQAAQDLIYLRADQRGRGLGKRFIAWCDQQLKAEGVQVVAQHVKAAHPALRTIVEAQGYELQDLIYTKRLDQPVKWPVPTHNAEVGEWQ